MTAESGSDLCRLHSQYAVKKSLSISTCCFQDLKRHLHTFS